MALFTKDGSFIRSYDENLKEINSSANIRGDIICVDNDVLYYFYITLSDKNFYK